MKKAQFLCNRNYTVGETDRNIYSSFIEHLGRAVYSGIYEPGHPEADKNGFRRDVMKLINDLRVPMIRYPGGNFVSCYNWKDGIGPKNERPKRLEYAWASVETNQFGIDEFAAWAQEAGIDPMISVNLGTGSIQDAGYFIEYCNHPSGTYWSDLRRKNGSEKPYDFKYWCLGNEMEGSWQAGHLSAEDYTKKALEAAKIMRWVDPRIKLIASGSSYEMLPSYMEWDRVMLDQLYEYVDFVSTHNYTMNSGQGTINFLASYKQLDDHIRNTARVIDYVKARRKSKKNVYICLDEWNVWNFSDIELNSLDDLKSMTTFKMTSAERWETAPSILQESYSLLDALTLGGLAITLLKNVDRVKIACLAQLVNVIAPITTKRGGGVLKQATYYPFQALSLYGNGTVLSGMTTAPEYESEYGMLPVVEQVAVYNAPDNEITIFALNCDQQESVELSCVFEDFPAVVPVRHLCLYGDDLFAKNTFEKPDQVTLRELPVPAAGALRIVLPKLSWNVISCRVGK
jgi:alpha-L-arabinofuranosidase